MSALLRNNIVTLLILLSGICMTSGCTEYPALNETPPYVIFPRDTSSIAYINGRWDFANCIIEKPADTYRYSLFMHTWELFTTDLTPRSKHILTIIADYRSAASKIYNTLPL